MKSGFTKGLGAVAASLYLSLVGCDGPDVVVEDGPQDAVSTSAVARAEPPAYDCQSDYTGGFQAVRLSAMDAFADEMADCLLERSWHCSTLYESLAHCYAAEDTGLSGEHFEYVNAVGTAGHGLTCRDVGVCEGALKISRCLSKQLRRVASSEALYVSSKVDCLGQELLDTCKDICKARRIEARMGGE